jgi:phosphoribosylformimino-5-aminoimidazole carboxamide ribotide isomerase
MQIIPVLDLLDSVVVRGVGGRRDEYQPVVSQIAPSANPLDVAEAFRDTFGLDTFYIADLDAILHGQPNHDVHSQLRDAGFKLLIDGGIKNAAEADTLLTSGATKVVAALETWPLLSSLELLARRIGPEQLIFSLDLKGGVPVRRFSDLISTDPVDIGAVVIEAGVREMIVLDLADVGVGTGVSTGALCESLRDFAPRLRLIAGGGVRSVADLDQLQSQRIDGCLIASALHNGAISAEQIATFAKCSGAPGDP